MGKSTKDKRDIHYRSAKQEGYRARSAFKLLHLDETFNGRIFHGVKKAVDLCAAPGSWSQVLSNKLYMPNNSDLEVKILAVDFLRMVPIPGVVQLQGDITQVSTAERILAEFGGEKADLVVCDGAPDVTGLHELDIHRHQDIVVAGLAITTAILKEGGTMVMKVFKKENDRFLPKQISTFFRDVSFIKPESSRDSSLEMFAVGFGHYSPANYTPRMLLEYFASGDIGPYLQSPLPFVLHGDLNYALPESSATNEKKSVDNLPNKFCSLNIASDMPSGDTTVSAHQESSMPLRKTTKSAGRIRTNIGKDSESGVPTMDEFLAAYRKEMAEKSQEVKHLEPP